MAMEFLKSARQKTAVSEVTYYALNVALAVVLFAIARMKYPAVAIVLVLLSKWRALAVRPRFWWTNIQANMVDIIVGLSVVALMYGPQVTELVQIGLTVFYAVWLLFLKPMSKRWQMMIQSAIAIILGVTALLSVSYEWPPVLVVLLALVIGYSVARHFLSTYDEEQITLLSMIWGVVCAEAVWLGHYWTFSYPVFGIPALRVPQMTIIILLLSFLAGRVYRSWKKHNTVLASDVIAPALLVGILTIMMLLQFNSVAI